MARIDYSAEKWNRKMANAGTKWKSRIDKAVANNNFEKGLSEYTGQPANPVIVDNWKKGVSEVTAADFQAAVQGKGDKWKRRYLEVMTA